MIMKLFDKVTRHITPSPWGRKGWGLSSLILSGLAMVSCVDTVLLPDSKTVEEDFWQTKSDVAMMVNGAYAAMANKDLQQRLVVWTSRSDELNVNSALNNSALNQIYTANIQTTNTYADWAQLYSVINCCNLVLDKSASVMDIDPNYLEGDHRNNVGQMKALRALCYFYLIRVYRDVPLILDVYKNSSQEMNVPQVAPGIILDQIIADLEEVRNYTLSTQSIKDWTRCGYFTRDGVLALLADAYLWKASIYGDESCYDKCIACCNQIRNNRKNAVGNGSFGYNGLQLDDDGFDLNSYYDYFNLFVNGGNDKEALLELEFTNNEGLGIVYNQYKNNSTYPQFYTNSFYATVGTAETSVFNHTNHAYDVRGFESVYSFNVATDDGSYIRKFVSQTKLSMMNQNPAAETKLSRPYDGYDQNWILYRVTDVMLMKAEALVQKALLQAKANEGLIAEMAAAATTADSLEVAKRMLEVNKVIAGYNVTAARQAQIVSDRASIDYTKYPIIDSTKYAVSTADYVEGADMSAFARQQAGIFSGFTATAEELEKLVMDERARELCFEGKRWFDMLRYNYRHTTDVRYDVILGQQGGAFAKNYDEMLKLVARKYTSGGGSGVTSKMPTEPYLYMPILQDQIDVNPLLIQNPVYSSNETMDKNY